jgi:CRP-like cAMP-binding protein
MGAEDGPLLAHLDLEDRRRVLSKCRRMRIRAGGYLFHAGEAGDTLHLIDRGLVGILAGSSLGEPFMLTVLGPGQVFGEQALLSDDRARTATAQALQQTETLALSRQDFEELRRRHPSVDRFLIAILSAQVRRLSDQVVELIELPAPARVYRRIVAMGELFGGTDGTVIPLTQSQLASLAGVKLRVTNRVVAEARRNGLLQTGRHRLVLVDFERLRVQARAGRRLS